MRLNFSIFLFLFFVSGCATLPERGQETQGAIFFPPKPEEPRLQFLTSFSSSEDLKGSPSGFKRFIVGEETDVNPIVKPYGVTIYDNKIYICDTVLNTIEILDLKKRQFEYFRPKEKLQLIDPINLSFDGDGNMYVADSRRGQVVIFDKYGNSLGAIGKKSEFKPTDVLIDRDKIYICDLKSSSIKVFGLKDRTYLFSIPQKGATAEAGLFSPTNIATDEDGSLYVSDTGAFRVQKYSAIGEFLVGIGSHGDSPGQLSRPKGVSVDKQGRIYVVDAAFENAQVFDRDGKLLLFFAEPGESHASLVLPAGITIDYSLKDYFSSYIDPSFEVEHLVFITSQYGDRKLSVYGFGRRKTH